MLYLATVSIVWAFSFGIIGNSLMSVDSFLVSTLRLAFASIAFLPFIKPKYIQGLDGLKLFLFGSIQFGLMYVCYMKAYQYLPSHLVALFSISTPIYVTLINDIRKRLFSVQYFLAALLSVCGALVIKIQSLPSGDFWLGFALMQIAGFSFAFGQIAYRDWKHNYPEVPDSAIFVLLTFGGTVCAGLFSLAFADKAYLVITSTQWISIIYLGLVASGLGFFLWNKGATKTNPGTLAVFNNAVVPLAMLISLFIFGEIDQIKSGQLIRLVIGGLLIAIALLITSQSNKCIN